MSTRPSLVSRPSSIAGANKTVVLVSGGNAGIGYEIVKSLASSQPNYQVLMGCRDTKKGEEAAATMGALVNVNPIQLDISDDESLDHCYRTIEQMFGKLDILINNAGTAGNDLRRDGAEVSVRQQWEHVSNINTVSTGVFTEKMIPLLQNSKLGKIIFVSSTLGSIGTLAERGIMAPVPDYIASKAAVNALAVYYSKKYPKFKVNTICPGLRATGLAPSVEKNEKTDPALGAVQVVRLATEGLDGVTGTYSSSEGPIPW